MSFQIAYISNHTREFCSKMGRELLSSIAQRHPFILSSLLHSVQLTIGQIGMVGYFFMYMPGIGIRWSLKYALYSHYLLGLTFNLDILPNNYVNPHSNYLPLVIVLSLLLMNHEISSPIKIAESTWKLKKKSSMVACVK